MTIVDINTILAVSDEDLIAELERRGYAVGESPTIGQVSNSLIKVYTIAGPWFSLGFHLDFQKWYADIHFIWWIITIGNDYYTKVS